jgi:hypothetical protein
MDAMTWVAVSVAAVIVLAGAGLLWARLREAAAGTAYHFRCPGCGHRIRYAALRVGRRGQCPHCGKSFVFPPGDPGAGTGPRK